jgi:hypothetical protein
MSIIEFPQAIAIRKLRNALNYLHSRYGGIEATMFLAQHIKKVMPLERPDLKPL